MERGGPELLLSHPEQMGYRLGIQTSVPLQWKTEVKQPHIHPTGLFLSS